MAPTMSNVCLRRAVTELYVGQSITQSRLAWFAVAGCWRLANDTQGSMRHHGLVTNWMRGGGNGTLMNVLGSEGLQDHGKRVVPLLSRMKSNVE